MVNRATVAAAQGHVAELEDRPVIERLLTDLGHRSLDGALRDAANRLRSRP
jgi:hypothetical protein